MRFNSGCHVVAIAAVLLFSSPTKANPTGAAECNEGDLLLNELRAAPHRTRDIVTGSLEDNGFEFLLDGQSLVPGQPTEVAALLAHDIELRAPDGGFFRGFLVRIGDPIGLVDTFEYLQSVPSDADVQVSEICTDNEETGGITHTFNNEKTSVRGTLVTEFVDFPVVELTIDVTAVVQNRGTTSEWYYSRFSVNSISSESTASPTAPPVGGLPNVFKPLGGNIRFSRTDYSGYAGHQVHRGVKGGKGGGKGGKKGKKHTHSKGGKGGKKGKKGKKGKMGKKANGGNNKKPWSHHSVSHGNGKHKFSWSNWYYPSRGPGRFSKPGVSYSKRPGNSSKSGKSGKRGKIGVKGKQHKQGPHQWFSSRNPPPSSGTSKSTPNHKRGYKNQYRHSSKGSSSKGGKSRSKKGKKMRALRAA